MLNKNNGSPEGGDEESPKRLKKFPKIHKGPVI